MDVTNPGLVNVADQVVGNPDVSVDSMSVPLDDDSLVPAADEGYPPAPGQTSQVFPTPTEADAGASQLPSAPQSTGQAPGTAPAYAPFPPDHNAVAVDQQDVTVAGTSEYTVAGPRTSIQTNRNPESERTYAVSSVLDADTGGPVVEPAQVVSGSFVAVFDETTKIRLASPTSFPASLVDGVTVGVSCPAKPAYSQSGIVSSVVNAGGSVSGVSSAGGGTSITVSSYAYSLAGVVAGAAAVISGTGAAGYDGAHAVSNVNNLLGTFAASRNSGTGSTVFVSPATTGLSVGKVVTVSGAYGGPNPVTATTEYAGSFDAAADAGGGVVTFHSTPALPASMINGQFVTLAGAIYSGTYQISGVTANTFDCSPAGGYTATDAGTFESHTFTVGIAFSSDYSGTWACRTFDVAVAYTSGATGAWRVSNFDVPGTYDGTAAGTWSYYPTDQLGTTRYRLGLLPADLDSFGVSLQDREVVFADPTLTAADSGASRLIQFATRSWIVVGKYDPEDDVPTLTTPQPGDQLTLYVQREGSETFVEQLGQVVDANPSLLPAAAAPAPQATNFAEQGTSYVSTGPQPGAPVLTSGVQVPTAVTVQVADQATSVGLPANVFA